MHFNPVVVYAPGKDLVIADTLSRSPLVQEKPDSDLEESVTAHVAAVEAMLPASTSKLAQIGTTTASDTQLQTVLRYIRNGWPNHYRGVHEDAKEFFPDHANLAESNGLIIHG